MTMYNTEVLTKQIREWDLLFEIWTKPKRTLKYILENCPDKYVILFFILGGIDHGLSKASVKNMGDKMSTLSVFTLIISIQIVGWLGYYFFAWIMSKMGRWINGTASPRSFRTVIAWSMVPSICSLILEVPRFIIFGDSLFASSILEDSSMTNKILYFSFGIIDSGLAVWTFIILVKGVSLIQKFKTGRALLNVSLYYLIIYSSFAVFLSTYYFLIFGLLFTITIIFLVILIRQQMKMERVEQRLLKSKLEVQEQVLEDVSQAIHESKNELLGVKFSLNQMNPAEPELLQERIAEAKCGLNKVLQELKETSRELNPGYINDIGFANLVRGKITRLEKDGKYQTQITINGSIYRLEQEEELTIFSLVNNVFSNIIEHANATSINVRLNYLPEAFILEISDNGQGFDPQVKQGLGLRDMKAKAKLIGAILKIKSELRNGTTVQIILPQTISKY